VIRFLRSKSIFCHAIASYDVIEHIYDIEGFLKKLPALAEGDLTVVMSSGANPFNPLIRKSIMKKQLEIEYKDREKEWGHKERDCLRAYLKVREEIILNYAPVITKKEAEHLARATRGMIDGDIRKCVDEYLKGGTFPPDLSHPTNTCDPYTGNWAENLMDLHRLRDILSTAGFEAEILIGNYGCYQRIVKRLAGIFLNLGIYILKKQGIRIAPFFTLYGRRRVSQSDPSLIKRIPSP
jgi:hypothetical protein